MHKEVTKLSLQTSFQRNQNDKDFFQMEKNTSIMYIIAIYFNTLRNGRFMSGSIVRNNPTLGISYVLLKIVNFSCKSSSQKHPSYIFKYPMLHEIHQCGRHGLVLVFGAGIGNRVEHYPVSIFHTVKNKDSKFVL